MPDNTSRLPKNDPWAFTFLIAVALAAAVVTGASLSGVASGAMQDLLRTAGVGRDNEIMAEQRRHAAELERIELSIGRARADIAVLNARVDEAENLYQEAVDSAQSIDRELELGTLRTSLDEETERNRIEFNAVNKRIDWLEKLVYNLDVTGAAQPPTLGRRRSAQSAPGRFVLHAEKGVAVIAGRGGAIDVTPGFMVPELGRVAAIRQEDRRWVVVTDKGMTIRERWGAHHLDICPCHTGQLYASSPGIMRTTGNSCT
jgi:hypothetical protein